MASDLPVSGPSHPAPHRGRASPFALWFAILAPPLAWSIRLMINTVIAGRNCKGAEVMAVHPAGRVPLMLTIDLAAFIIAMAGCIIAFRCWQQTKAESGEDTRRLMHLGEGRTRFLALCGLLTSSLFAVAVLVDALGIVLGPPC
ncbi:hypothetical protein [Hyphomicrobium sp.]|uniref:hypothetical protein n=1 Tax=Hyphomicrobium sp. TaxID=82 RepID=UPI002D781FDF|nr:hypothetical protein [Hyphomicrobium sp.]HET6390032.1 hypothetical protein [Hyphomicrobium sp.]